MPSAQRSVLHWPSSVTENSVRQRTAPSSVGAAGITNGADEGSSTEKYQLPPPKHRCAVPSVKRSSFCDRVNSTVFGVLSSAVLTVKVQENGLASTDSSSAASGGRGEREHPVRAMNHDRMKQIKYRLDFVRCMTDAPFCGMVLTAYACTARSIPLLRYVRCKINDGDFRSRSAQLRCRIS